jgi:hypothetical protein
MAQSLKMALKKQRQLVRKRRKMVKTAMMVSHYG